MSGFEFFWLSLYQPISIFGLDLAFTWMDVIFSFVLPVAVYLVLGIFFRMWLRNYLERSTMSDERKAKLRKAGIIVYRVVLVLILLGAGSRFLEDRIIKFFEGAYEFLTRPLLNSGISFMTLILALPVVYASLLAGRAAKLAFDRSRFITQGLEENRKVVLSNLIRWGVMTLVLILGLSIIGLNLASVGFFLGILGFAVSIGLWQITGGFFAGVIISMNRIIRTGDWVTVECSHGRVSGRVHHTRMMSVEIRSPGGEIYVVPSAQVVHGIVRHPDHDDQAFRIVLSLVYTVDSDPSAIEETLLGCARSVEGIMTEPAPAAIVGNIGPEGIAVDLVAFASLEAAHETIRSSLLKAVWTKSRAAGLNFVGQAAVPAAKTK